MDCGVAWLGEESVDGGSNNNNNSTMMERA